MANAITNS